MQKRKAVVSSLILALSLAVANPAVLAAVPSTMNYQGQLGNAAGAPVNGAVSITFSLYDVASGGAALWSETQNITVTNGLYHTALGQITPLTPTLFGMPLFLGIKVGNDAEMTPRSALGSSATALRAQMADSLSCAGCVTAAQIAGASIASAIPAGAITAAQLAPGVIPAGGAIPAGTVIMNASITPPAGYTYLGTAPSTESWRMKASMPTPRTSVSAAVVNNKLYAIGGQNLVDYIDPVMNWKMGTFTFPLAVNEVYDPATNTWATRAPMPTARSHSGVDAIGSKIYVVGGRIATTLPLLPPAVPAPLPGVYAETAITEEYDPVANVWVTKAPMPTARDWLSAATIAGKLYALGGSGTNVVGGVRTIYANNEEYDPVANTWIARAPMPTARLSFGLAVVNNKLYAMGGRADKQAGTQIAPIFATLFAVNEEYDPLTNTWATKAPMPELRTGFAAGTINGRIHAVGGWGMFFNTFKVPKSVEYDPVANQWAYKADMAMHTAGIGEAAGVINNRLYVVGGDDMDGSFFTILHSYCQEYDPGTQLFMHVKQ